MDVNTGTAVIEQADLDQKGTWDWSSNEAQTNK